MLNKHKHEAKYVAYCMVRGCQYQTTSATNFRQHSRRMHNSWRNDAHVVDEMTGKEMSAEASGLPPLEEAMDLELEAGNLLAEGELNVRRHGHFLLGLQTQYRVSRTAVQGAFEGMMDLNADTCQDLKRELAPFFKPGTEGEVAKIFDLYFDRKRFDSIKTDHRRQRFYKTFFKPIPPRSVYMGTDEKGEICTAHIVPFLTQLEAVLNMPEMHSALIVKTIPENGVMGDMRDGSFVQDHQFTEEGREWVQVLMSFDDLELQNPLKSNHAHKMSMFYFTLLNIPVESRSKLTSIFTIAIARSMDVKDFGFEPILADFKEGMVKLKTDGVMMEIHGVRRLIFGNLIGAVCDHPAAGQLGGFKEGTNAWKACRTCTANQETRKEKFTTQPFRRRNMPEYLDQCASLAKTTKNRNYTTVSRIEGVNSKSTLCSIPGFDVTRQLMQDPMHVILEGCFSAALAMILKVAIYEEKLFTLKKLNLWMDRFPYCYMDKDKKPYNIEKVHIQNVAIKQKASTMLLLAYIMPLFLGRFMDPLEHTRYHHFLLMVVITKLAFTPFADKTTAGNLELLIAQYGDAMADLYPEVSIKPKLHFLVHLPDQLEEFGPLKHQSAMRFEGKHGFFKAHTYRNFKNMPMTMTNQHQLYLCFKTRTCSGALSQNFFDAGISTGEGQTTYVRDCPMWIQESLLEMFSHTVLQSGMYTCPWLQFKGKKYRPGVAMLLAESDIEGPTFGMVRNVFLLHRRPMLLCEICEPIHTFANRYNSYQVTWSGRQVFKMLDTMKNAFPLPVYSVNSVDYICNRYATHDFEQM